MPSSAWKNYGDQFSSASGFAGRETVRRMDAKSGYHGALSHRADSRPAQWRALLCYLFFNDTATTEIYTLSLHDALPISLHDDDAFAGIIARSPEEISLV